MGCCLNCIGGIFVKILQILLSIIKIGCAIAIVIIVALHLTNVNYGGKDFGKSIGDWWNSDWSVEATCVLGNINLEWNEFSSSTNLCTYAYVVCGVSLATSLALSIFFCLTCDCCGCGFVLEAIISGLATGWWLAAALVFSNYVSETNQDGVWSLNNWRNAVVVLAWVAFAAFALTFLISLIKAINKCICCGGDGGKANAV